MHFEKQLQRSIDNEVKKLVKGEVPVPKSQVLLPKLKKDEEKEKPQGKGKTLERELQDEMSRMMMDELDKADWLQ